MEEIKTAHWLETKQRWRQIVQNVPAEPALDDVDAVTRVTWIRLDPPTRAWRSADAKIWLLELFDERGTRFAGSIPKLFRNRHAPPAPPTCNAEFLLDQCLFPPPVEDKNLVRTYARELHCEWQQRPVVWEGLSLIKWHREYVLDNFAVREVVFSDPETCRIVRKEHRETDLLTGAPLHHTVCDQYTYNEEAPPGTFEIPADKEIVLTDRGMTPREVWDTFSVKERQAIEQVIARSDAGWQRSDFAEFRSVWRFSMWSILPKGGDWEKRLQQQSGLWKPWQSEVTSARIQDYIPMAAATDVAHDTQEGRRVLRVNVKLRVEGDEDTWEGEAQYYLRRRFGRYQIVHWEFPWEEIKASKAGACLLPFGTRRAFDDTAFQEAAKSGDEDSFTRLLTELPSFAQVDSALQSAATIRIVRQLVSYGADVQALGWNDETPLFHARTVEIARFLVELGADVHAQTPRGGTPLHNAVVDDRLNVAEYLIACGAEVNDTTVPLGCQECGHGSDAH